MKKKINEKFFKNGKEFLINGELDLITYQTKISYCKGPIGLFRDAIVNYCMNHNLKINSIKF